MKVGLRLRHPAGSDGEKVIVCCDRGGIRALSGVDLELRWSVDVKAPITASPVIVTCRVNGPTVVIGDEDGVLHALNLDDGSHHWLVEAGDCIRATVAYDASANALFVGVYGPWLMKVDMTSGAVHWKTYLPKHEFFGGTKRGLVSSPLLADVDLDGELEVVVGVRSRRIFCVSAGTGRLKWFREVAYDPDSSPSFAIVKDDSMVFSVGESTRRVWAIGPCLRLGVTMAVWHGARKFTVVWIAHPLSLTLTVMVSWRWSLLVWRMHPATASTHPQEHRNGCSVLVRPNSVSTTNIISVVGQKIRNTLPVMQSVGAILRRWLAI